MTRASTVNINTRLGDEGVVNCFLSRMRFNRKQRIRYRSCKHVGQQQQQTGSQVRDGAQKLLENYSSRQLMQEARNININITSRIAVCFRDSLCEAAPLSFSSVLNPDDVLVREEDAHADFGERSPGENSATRMYRLASQKQDFPERNVT